MAIFKIKAKDAQGKFVNEVLEAETQKELIDTLHRRGLVVMGIEEQRSARKSRFRRRIKADELVVFSRQLATMVNAGLPLMEGLRTLYEQVENNNFRQVVAGVVDQVEGGSSFADAIAMYPRVFGAFFINMVRAGEASGQLSEILDRIADYLESISSLRRKIKMAMMYPAIVSIMAGLITMILFLKVIPIFEGIYADFDAALPLPTQVLIMLSKYFRKYFVYIVIIMVVGLFLLARYKRTEPGKKLYDRLIFKLPVFGNLLKKVAISRFTRTLSTLVASGVPILHAFEIVKEVSGNKMVEQAVASASDRIREGKSIEEPLRQSGIFPPLVTKMISVGEKSGRLDEMLNKISVYYDEQVTAVVAGLTSIIEPILIAFLGIVVGGIVLSMFLPIFRLSSIVGG